MGRGRGQGPRPEADTDTGFYDTKVKQKIGKQGAADLVGFAEGKNIRGDVQQEIQEQFESVRRGSTDPLTNQRIPRSHRQHVREYYDHFQEGE